MKDRIIDFLALLCYRLIMVVVFSLPYVVPIACFFVMDAKISVVFYLIFLIMDILLILFYIGYLVTSIFRQDVERIRRCVDGIIIPLGAGITGTIVCWLTGIFQNL